MVIIIIGEVFLTEALSVSVFCLFEFRFSRRWTWRLRLGFYPVKPCSSEGTRTFQSNILSSSSGSKSSPACRLLLLFSCFGHSSTLKMKAVCCSETTGCILTTWLQNSWDRTFYYFVFSYFHVYGVYATRIYVDSRDLTREFIWTLAEITHNRCNTLFRV
jgi:hypothetical protein